ncbi:Fibropellin-1 [Orchesella cincta]|uniref:Fibropellin-1 n=1 Tax=Orchesella cincta TaxID=48709 RepID=A0A1D2NMB5_ORCCI|nr:Fibropellin-1 [Orchesella cincta]
MSLYGSELVEVDSWSSHNWTLALAKRFSHGDPNFWLGFNTLDDLRTNTLDSASGSLLSQYAGFWAEGQPNTKAGRCVQSSTGSSTIRSLQSWELTKCENLMPFVCKSPACPKGSYLCSNGKCINNAFRCDKQDDCGDSSDELDCPELCRFYKTSVGAFVESPGFPSRYPSLSDCKWTLEAPEGHSIVLQFSEFETEKGFDTVQVLGGARTEAAAVSISTLSGRLNSSAVFTSASNFMIVKFRSDASVEKKGFRATWKTEPQSCGGSLRATSHSQVLTSPGYPNSYPGGLECVYVISAPTGKLITLKVEDFGLVSPRDSLLIRDGDTPSASKLALLTGPASENPRYITSTGSKLYLYLTTSGNGGTPGFQLKYYQGCEQVLTVANGSISSPAFGLSPYPSNQECTYLIKRPKGGPLSLRFTHFDLDDGDFVQVHDGPTTDSLRLHSGNGFSGRTLPKLTLTAESGEMTVRFVTDSLRTKNGFRAVFSADCPVLRPGKGALASSRDIAFGTLVTFTCPTGQEFATGQQKIITECRPGGQWSVDYIPDCQEVYCGPVPQISNGFAIGSTNVTYLGTATYQCYAGFAFPSSKATEVITCLASGKWEKLPLCLASQCPPLPETPNAKQNILSGGGRSYGTIVRFDCDPGYIRNGPPTLLCMSNGTWSGEVPTCSRKQCHQVPKIKYGFVVEAERDYFFDDEARVQCQKGYRLLGNSVVKCGPDQIFEDLPVCEDIDECANSQCDLASTECTNVPGSFYCKCLKGFSPSLECRNVGDLGLSSGSIPDSAITVSSAQDEFPKDYVRLTTSTEFGWCGANFNKGNNWVLIDLKAPTVVRGFRTQGVTRPEQGIAYASGIRVQYTDDLTDIFKDYTNPDGSSVEFRILEPTLSVLNFPVPIEARFVRLIIQDFVHAPCLQLELMGCTRMECMDDNECAVSNGGCHQKCVNSPGSFACGCNVGYELYAENGTAGFFIESSETGMKDGDMHRVNKTCVPKMCPPLVAPENGLLLSTKDKHHFGDSVSFQCNFGYVIGGNYGLTCTSTGAWNGTVPQCDPAKCVPLQDEPGEGLSVNRPDPDEILIGFQENVTFTCAQDGRPLRSSLPPFRQCVYDPKPGFPDYWLSGAAPECPKVDCGFPVETPGAQYGRFTDTYHESSFYFGCEDTFKLAGQSSRNDNIVRCQANGVWDFGNLRCEGPVCEDPSRPPDGIQISQTYEQGAEVMFDCLKPGYIPINPLPVTCQRYAECRVIKPLGITSGLIPDSAINVTSFRPNYEGRNIRLNSATGWCGTQEAFTYATIDLGKVHRVKAILVKGVITNDVVGRPTEIRFFYKKEENENFHVYFPNFNLTHRDPGNFGELAMITLPTSVTARFVILGIVNHLENACMKFELLGCEDEGEDVAQLGWDNGFPMCVDNEPPVFDNCPDHSIIVQKGPNGLEPVNFPEPTATDNSGMLARMEIRPQGFKMPLYVFEDMLVEYLAFDFDGNVAICHINITVPDDTPPQLSCPQSYVVELLDKQASYQVYFNETRRRINATDASGPVTVNFIPESSIIPVGGFENVTVVASDKHGNQATCHFQVSVQATPCVDWELSPPAHGNLNCVTSSDGLQCLATCKNGFRFTDGEPMKTFNCRDKTRSWYPSRVVPDCVSEDTEMARYQVDSIIKYRANGAVPASCLPQYADFLKAPQTNLNTILSQRCSAVNVNMNVSFVDSKPILLDENVVQFTYVLEVTPTVKQTQLYDLCGSTLNLIFDLSVPYASAVLEPLLNVSSVANQCPPLRALTSKIGRGFTCGTGEVLNTETSTVPRCLHCPAGTFAAEGERECVSCPRGFYQSRARQGACSKCPPGTFTRETGSKSIDECVPVCGFGTYSPTGLVPCLECPRNSYTGAPPADGFKECTACPPKTFTYQPAAPGPENCRAKCQPGTYSPTGLAPCAPCPAGFHQSREGLTRCNECAPEFTTLKPGAQSREECVNVQCNEEYCTNGGLCLPQNHGPTCVCPAGFTGERCELDIDECESAPCYNAATCVDEPQGYRCVCPPGYTGINCQDQEPNCKNDTCPEQAMCKTEPGLGNHTCLCKNGYTGTNCDITVNPCTSGPNPCENNAKCVPLQQGRFRCECQAGWEGPLCEANIDDCAELPCLLNANCTDLVNDFDCDCPKGFSGKRCETKVDLCGNSPCMHGICVDRLFEYECVCDPGWKGDACDININECATDPCLNNGECIDEVGDFKCVCEAEYTGKRCQHRVDDCLSNPCQNQGTCMDRVNGFECLCRPGFVGLQCEAEIDECLSNPCDPEGTENCVDLDNKYQCQCRPGFTGEQCETNIDECENDPCLNGGTCVDGVNSFSCRCLPGWSGQFCEEDISYCESTPCQNDAKCINLFEDYFCVCPSGTDGKQCETAPDRCIGDPCMNSGSCKDYGSGLNCSCPSDYNGIGCQYEFDACAEGVCQNGATCVDKGAGYKCLCPEGYTGRNCDQSIPHCKANSCPPTATCVDLSDGFYCKCPFNLTGEDCRKTIQVDYDLVFTDEEGTGSAQQFIPFQVNKEFAGFSLGLWVKFTHNDDTGTFLNYYVVKSPISIRERRLAIQAHSAGMLVSLFNDETEVYLPFREYAPVNDGQWHHVVLIYDKSNSSLVLITDGLIAGKSEGYGQGKSLPEFGWISLGAPASESGLILPWNGYDKISGGVERVVPSTCGDRVCPPGMSGARCDVMVMDKTPPQVTHCPGSMWVITRNGSATVTWDEPVFTDNVGVVKVEEKQGFRPGQTLLWGNYDIAYVAYDQAGNNAMCRFKVYVLAEFCPALLDPEGGASQCSGWGPGGHFKACEITCNSGLKFSQSIPKFYACGAEGFWHPSQDIERPLVFPACTGSDLRKEILDLLLQDDYNSDYSDENNVNMVDYFVPSVSRPAQRVFKVKIQFPSAGLCNEAGQGVLRERIKLAIAKLNQDWRFCASKSKDGAECQDLNIGVLCDKKSRSLRAITKRQADNEDVYDVEISFPALSDPVTNVNTNERSNIKKLLQALILENDAFDVRDVLPNTAADPTSLDLASDYACAPGHVVVGSDCVPCASGSFFSSVNNSCDVCTVGTYQSETGQLECRSCPSIAGKPGITKILGARSPKECKERCPAGKYFDESSELCKSCGYGQYQPEEGQFSCKLCGLGKTTQKTDAVSELECRDECSSGHELSSEGICVACRRGTYRTQGIHPACASCPIERTTQSTGATAIEDCTLPICRAGSYLNTTANRCQLCDRGTYQSDSQQTKCITCPADTSTKTSGATKIDDCYNPCDVNGVETLCDPNAHCLHIPETGDYVCQCKPGFNGTGDTCIDLCEGFCHNEGTCHKDKKGQPFCECSGSFIGKQCLEKSDFAYIAGGIAAGVFFIIVLVLLIWMICHRSTKRREPKKLLAASTIPDPTAGSQVNFYYGAPSAAPYAESIAPSHHSTYAHYYDDEEDGWDMPNFYNETYMKEGYANGQLNSLARSNASIYGNKEDLYDRLRRHAYQGKKGNYEDSNVDA